MGCRALLHGSQDPAPAGPHPFQKHQGTLGFLVLVHPAGFHLLPYRVLVLLQPNQHVHMETALVSQHLFDTLPWPLEVQILTQPQLLALCFRETLTQATLLFQRPWSHPAYPPVLSPLGLGSPLDVSAEATPGPRVFTNTQGTQTLTSTVVKDSSQQTDCGTAVLNKEIIQLSSYLKEALHRELLLKQKMVILQELLSTLLQASEKSWQGQLNEDKLKCKLRALENQLQACTQSYSKECVKKILIEMEDQKQTYEQKAKEALQKMLEDKLQAEQQLQNSQRCLEVTREDLALWKVHYTTLKAEWTQMTKTQSELESNLHVLQSKLQHTAAQNEQLQQALDRLQQEHAELQQRASALQEDNQLQAEHISTIEGKLQKEQNQKLTLQSQKLSLEATISHLHNLMQNQTNERKMQEAMVQRKDQVFTTQSPPLTPAKETQNALLKHPEEEAEESLKAEIQKRTSQLTAKENEVYVGTQVADVKIPHHQAARAQAKSQGCCGSPAGLGVPGPAGLAPANAPANVPLQCQELRAELEALSEEYRSCLTRLRQCRDELNHVQSKPAKRQRGNWLPLLLAVIAMAMAAFLANYRP
ncbi:TRAF3-interacting JNK-activating modulator isoform X1 [Cygnus olor]|uniref:TRAF3-interacting JNK-activating modulator isoform X1 n=1 Tax=Cygnus olor TaxID=8869 RepID=UPI001ADE518B|nr:TRAF3-interacting JNK-activating modulator isoform X1 [Cygnus olor]